MLGNNTSVVREMVLGYTVLAFFLAKKETKKHFASKITPSGADRPDKGPPVKRRNRFDFSVYLYVRNEF